MLYSNECWGIKCQSEPNLNPGWKFGSGMDKKMRLEMIEVT